MIDPMHETDTGLLASLAREQVKLRSRMRGLDGPKAAATFGGLLTDPRLQPHSLRLETLAHFAVAGSTGGRTASYSVLKDAFSSMGDGACGYLEDPPEGLFVDLVRTPRGHFRIVSGIWESSGFFLQRVMNLLEQTPKGPGYDDIRDSCYALLRVSEHVCERAGLARYETGGHLPLNALPHDLALSGAELRARVTFTIDDLTDLGVSPEQLLPFVFNPDDAGVLLDGDFGATELERRPLIVSEGHLNLALPTAVSPAIRRALVEALGTGELAAAFPRALAEEYADLFSGLRLMGGKTGRGIRFQKVAGGSIASMSMDVDEGRHLQYIFLVDDLSGFETTALASPMPDPTASAAAIDEFIRQGVAAAVARPNFQSGVIVLVGCGIGRPTMQAFEGTDDPRFKIESLSAADMETLSWLRGFTPLSLFRILDAQERLEQLGARLFNPNGLLNLVGWSRALEGHLAPHGALDDGSVDGDAQLMIVVEQTTQKSLREEVAQGWDAHVEQDIHGRYLPVRREGLSLFSEDKTKPSYVAEEPPPRSVCVTPRRTWWCVTNSTEKEDPKLGYERWLVTHIWLAKAAPVLDEEFPELPQGPIEWRATFEGILQRRSDLADAIDFDAACAAITASADPEAPRVETCASARWELAHAHVENGAERALVDALIRATAQLAGVALTAARRAEILTRIVPNTAARQQHAFRIPSFRDLVSDGVRNPVVIIEREDDAAARLGLGWTARQRSEGAVIRGKSECVAFLNKLVRTLEEDLVASLGRFDRLQMLTAILENHEGAAREVSHWNRTAAAVLALHDDEAAVSAEILDREAKMNAVALASRILLEFAICACPETGGRAVGDLDLARLMSIAALIFHTGGDSDAIRWDAMEPTIRITPLGDVHANREFGDVIVDAFAKTTAGHRLKDAVESYADNVLPQEDDPEPSVASEDEGFDAAIVEAFGADRDVIASLLLHVEALAIEADSAVISLPRSRLLLAPDVPPGMQQALGSLIDTLTFESRATWRSVPDGYEARDIHAWRFRRRLTVLRKPFLEISAGADPELLFAPAMVREAVRYMLANYRRGDFNDSQLGSLMGHWKKRAADRRGKAFSELVASTLAANGWRTEPEVKMTKLLGRKLDRDYGDVDVLAWHEVTGRILLIECKDVQYRKTFGEVAEQLSDFRGELRSNGKPDYLLRHLTRVQLATENAAVVQNYVGLGHANLESHLVFRNTVPMKFALDHLKSRVSVHTLDELLASLASDDVPLPSEGETLAEPV